jgi:hypothetical protein
MFIKNLLFISLSLSAISSANAAEISAWECSAQSGMMGADTTKVRLEKHANGYAVYLTAKSGDVGEPWEVSDALVADGLDCKFSTSKLEPLYCLSTSNGWTTVTAQIVKVDSVDQTSGEDLTTSYTSVILSGTSDVLKVFKSSVLEFAATDCSRK